ncbi:MAG: 5'-methylthioadenosine phosphorylase [Legionellales bacterium]|nr:5'-methylthioadenosine phosphorylase [Legionellales bacterium]|tara:strand:- start:78 stop:830 length:753 start_codon:yes stop_codon:yes gene_type:complete
MSKLAVIGGSALPTLRGLEVIDEVVVETPYGEPSAPILRGQLEGREVLFLDRHGRERCTPPHRINYRANVWALHHLGTTHIISGSVVGGIRSDMTAGHFVFPDQLIDYTYGRANTFFEDEFDFSRHVDFTHPYCPDLHRLLVDAAEELGLDYTDDATYGVTQGPRFETIAEVKRLERDGCDVVGMTAMPEAALAQEMGIRYASVAVVGGRAAGRTDGLQADIEAIRQTIEEGMQTMRELLRYVFLNLGSS